MTLATATHSPFLRRGGAVLGALAAALALTLVLGAGVAAAACGNPVSCENALPGSPPSAWQISGTGDSSIEGYATTMSVNKGETIRFKIKTSANAYHIDIYRLGYYQGNGARLQASNVRPTASLPQSQPACQTTASTGLIDCGNWAQSASWSVPAAAVSGVYIARLVRDDTGGASHIPFVVRDDAGNSDMLLRTSDSTWQAYNLYGGNSLYRCSVSCPPGNPDGYKSAFAVSYNRPFDGTLPGDGGRSYLFYAEYQMIRFVERNGYDVSYTSQADAAASALPLRSHKLIVSSGHDEYWSGPERTNVEAARDAGVNLAFFSGNEVFWKTRWAADSSGAQYRTLISYKDSHFTQATDPVDWTGTWRDPRLARSGQGTPPENSLSGQLFIVNSGSSNITVPGQYRNLRLWRNTPVASLAPNGSLTLAPGGETLGYEWDVDTDNGFRPAGQFRLSSTTVSGVESFVDYGSFVEKPTTQTHNLTMYRAPSGALVFGAGTVQWAWGLDVSNGWAGSAPDPPGAAADQTMQQATVNLFADMGLQADTRMTNLAAAAASTDTVAPSTTITAPSNGAGLADGTRVTVSGTASDTGGTVAGIEVSTDGGDTWHPAIGTSSWTYSWVVHGAPHTAVMARAVDDSGNLEPSPASTGVDIACPCTMFGPNVTPWKVDSGDASSVEVGVRFKSDLNGTISGIRYYKASGNTGTHVGTLWRTDGTILARGTFTGESGSGWQQVTFQTPVDIDAGTTYVASYHAPNGHYSVSDYWFYKPSPAGGNIFESAPLRPASANGGGGNGVFQYASSPSYPALGGDGANYSVDVVFTPSLPPGPVTSVTATAGAGSATVNFNAPAGGGVPSRYIVTPYLGAAAQPSVTVTGSPPAPTAHISGLNAGSSYTFRVQAANANGTSALSAPSNAVTPTAPTVPGAATDLVASQGNGKVNLQWTAPNDGGRTITGYTVTPYTGGVPLATTTVTGSPAPTTAVIPNLTNGTPYTFTVRATNTVGTGPESAQSNSVTPSPKPEFVQRMTIRNPSATTVQMTPTANVTQGNRMIVMAGAWSWSGATITGVTDTAGNTYTRVTGTRASDNTELSVWTAPITAGGGTKPAVRVTANGTADIGAAAVEYANLSPAAGLDAVDRSITATGTAGTTGFVSTGPTQPVTGDNALALGFYVDSGFGRTLLADPAWTERVNVSPTDDMEFVVEESLPIRGDAPNARVSTGANTPWSMATVVFKTGAAQPPALAVSPAGLSFSGTAGGSNPAAKTLDVSNAGGGSLSWIATDDASWLSVSPASGSGAGTLTVTPSLSGLSAGTYTANVTVTASGVAGSPKVIPVTFTVAPPSPPVLSVSPATLSFSATTGGANPAAKTVSVANSGGGSLSWTASEPASWLSVSPASSTGDGTVTVTPSIAGLAAGTYTADVTIAAPGVSGSPKTVAVTLTVTDPPACPVPTGLVGAYGFDETTGTSAADASPTANTGTISGALRSSTGRFGGALSFDGVNDRVTVPDVNALDLTNGMTLEAWVNPTTADSAWRTVAIKERPSNLVYALYGSSDSGRPSIHVQTPLESDTRGTAALATNTWTHLASTYDGTTLRLYVNGTQVSSRAVSGSMAASTGVLSIGGNGVWGEWFAGVLDEVRVYNRALPASEIAGDMTTPVTCAGPPQPPALSVTPATLAFSGTQGGASPAAKTISVSNSGGGTLSWTASETASWLTVAPASGTNAGTITVTPNISGLTAGTYTTDVTVAAAGAGGSPKTVAVTLTVDPPAPVLTTTPASLSFSGTAGAADPAAKTIAISNTGGGTLSWTASETASWLSVSPGNGTNTGTVTVTPSITGLSAGTYTTDVTVTATGATGSPKTIPVTLTLDAPATPPVLAAGPASLSFTAAQGGANPAAKTISVSNTGGGTLSWTASDDASWMSVSPASGTNNAAVTVTPAISGLTAGTYTGTVTIAAAGVTGSPKTVDVTLTVDPPPPAALAVSPSTVGFTATAGGAAPAAQNVSVTNTGSGTLNWTAADDAAWLAVTPSGTAPSNLALTPSITGLAAGTYTATVTVTAAGATGSPKTIAVTLTVNPSVPANLIGAWGFDETTGNAVDASGRGHTGTISGATRTTAGRFGGALSFDGVNDLVTVADTNALDLTTGMTLEAWVRPTAIGSAWRSVLLKEQPGNLIYSLYAGDGVGRAATHIFTTADRGVSGSAATPVDTWTHLAATYDGATLRLFVNGVQAATRAQTGSIRASTGALRIGGNTIWSEWFAGLIDEVRVYNRALTAGEIQADMAVAVNADG